MALGHFSLLSGTVRDPVPSRTSPQDRLDRKMRNCKIGPTKTKVPYISANEEGLWWFSL